MELEFNRQILSLQNEINILKNALNPSFQLIQEIQEIRKKHHISSSYNISNIAIISLEVKEDILKDVTAMQLASDEKLNELKQEIRADFDANSMEVGKLKDELFSLGISSKEMSNTLVSLKNNTGENTMTIKYLQREMEQKATLNNIDEIRQVMKSMTPLSSYETLKSRVSDCVSTYQFQDIQVKVEVLKQKFKKFMKIEEVETKLKEFSLSLSQDFHSTYVSTLSYADDVEKNELLFKEINEQFSTAKDYTHKLDSQTNEKVRILKKALDSKP